MSLCDPVTLKRKKAAVELPSLASLSLSPRKATEPLWDDELADGGCCLDGEVVTGW